MSEQTSITDLAIAQVQTRDAFASAIVQTDEKGRTVLAIPPELSKKANVLAPSAVLTQEQPFFRPGFTVVTLDTDPDAGDYYELKGKLAPAKAGLQKLGDAAGISFDADRSFGKEGAFEVIELPTGRKVKVSSYTYHAVGHIRRPDGTVKELTADEEWQPHIALAELETGKSPEAWKVEKEFLFQAKKRAQIIRSKAMNGVLRQANPGIKQVYSKAEAALPFVVVAWSWSPDMQDENTGRIVASLVGADTVALYGPERSLPAPVDETYDVIAAEVDEDEVAPDIPDFTEAEVVEDAEVVAEGNLLKGKKLARLKELAAYRLRKSNFASETLLGVWHMDTEWFDALSKWAANAPHMAPDVLSDVESAAEFVQLVKANGGDVDG